MPATPLSDLQRAQSALQQHRQLGRRRIPATLRRQAVSLLTSHSRRHIITALGISYSMLSQWEQEVCAAGAAIPDPKTISFVRLPREAEPEFHTPHAVPALELRLSADTSVAFSGASATTDCLSLLQGLGYGRQGVCA